MNKQTNNQYIFPIFQWQLCGSCSSSSHDAGWLHRGLVTPGWWRHVKCIRTKNPKTAPSCGWTLQSWIHHLRKKSHWPNGEFELHIKEFFKNSAAILSSERILTGEVNEYQKKVLFGITIPFWCILFFNLSGRNFASGADVSGILLKFRLKFRPVLLIINSLFPYYFCCILQQKDTEDEGNNPVNNEYFVQIYNFSRILYCSKDPTADSEITNPN